MEWCRRRECDNDAWMKQCERGDEQYLRGVRVRSHGPSKWLSGARDAVLWWVSVCSRFVLFFVRLGFPNAQVLHLCKKAACMRRPAWRLGPTWPYRNPADSVLK